MKKWDLQVNKYDKDEDKLPKSLKGTRMVKYDQNGQMRPK